MGGVYRISTAPSSTSDVCLKKKKKRRNWASIRFENLQKVDFYYSGLPQLPEVDIQAQWLC